MIRQRNRPSEAASRAMQRYSVGDDAAFGELHELIAPRLYNFLIRRTGDPELSKDLLQQTLLQVHRARNNFLLGAEVLPWVFAIARRLLIDNARSRRTLLSTDELYLPSVRVASERADDTLYVKRLASRIAGELARLPEPQRVAFELVKQQGLSLAEAAGALKITVGALKLRIHRAQVALRAAVDGAEAA